MEISKDSHKKEKPVGAEKIEEVFVDLESLRKSLEEKYSNLPEKRREQIISAQLHAFEISNKPVTPASVKTGKKNLSLSNQLEE